MKLEEFMERFDRGLSKCLEVSPERNFTQSIELLISFKGKVPATKKTILMHHTNKKNSVAAVGFQDSSLPQLYPKEPSFRRKLRKYSHFLVEHSKIAEFNKNFDKRFSKSRTIVPLDSISEKIVDECLRTQNLKFSNHLFVTVGSINHERNLIRLNVEKVFNLITEEGLLIKDIRQKLSMGPILRI